jgi:hypothetical protein
MAIIDVDQKRADSFSLKNAKQISGVINAYVIVIKLLFATVVN